MSKTRPKAFLSSLYREHRDLRRQICEAGASLGVYVWVAEISRPELDRLPPLEIIDTLIKEVRRAEIFLCVLGPERHGSPIEVQGVASPVSYLEIELFQAAMLGKEIHLFITQGFQPDERLQRLMRILRFALPQDAFNQPLSGKDIRSAIQRLLGEKRGRRRWSRLWTSALGRLIVGLAQNRSAVMSAGNDPRGIHFLDGAFDTDGHPPNEDLIERAFAEEEGTENEEQRLARLWIVLRELLAAPYAEKRFAEYRAHWNRALEMWGKAAAWYGLHGHLYLGALAAQKSLAEVRWHLRQSRQSRSSGEVAHPGGGLASSYYSIARRYPERRGRRLLFERGLYNLEISLAEGRGDRADLLLIRGSILRRLGSSGAAVADYEEAVGIRQGEDDDATLGVALSELGFGYVLQGRLLKGRQFLEEGVDLLRGAGRIGFLIRALRKLAAAHALTGHPLRALEVRSESRQLAAKHGVFDQM